MNIKEYKIKEITFKQERELYSAYKASYNQTGYDLNKNKLGKLTINWELHDKAVNMALDFAFENPDEDLKGLSHIDIDKLGQELLVKYLRLDNDSKND
tara:strand:- start:613 stop:906 length:294 start_codon:yes stop_codon:yes gene_type:complete